MLLILLLTLFVNFSNQEKQHIMNKPDEHRIKEALHDLDRRNFIKTARLKKVDSQHA